MSRKHPASPALSGVSNSPGSEHYPPITAANCADLAFARKLVRQMRDGKGGRSHRRDNLRRASSRVRESEAERHLNHGTYTDAEQRKRDLVAPDGLPPRSGLPGPPVACDFDRLSFDEHLYEQPPYPWLDQFLADENAEFLARSRAQRSGWWCDWTPARDRIRAAHLQLQHPVRRRWQDCSVGDTVPAANMPFSSAEADALGHRVTLEWTDCARTFARFLHPLWVRTA